MTQQSMTKSELIERIVMAQSQSSGSQLSARDVELAVKAMIEQMSLTLAGGERIEIRGFGSFSLHYRAPRIGRNPKTGESVGLAGKYVPHFKPGKDLRDRVNRALEAEADGSRADVNSVAVSGGAGEAQVDMFGSTPNPETRD